MEIDLEPLLMLKSCQWVVVVVVVHLDYSISSGPFLSFEIEIGDGPGPKLDNNQQVIVHFNLCRD